MSFDVPSTGLRRLSLAAAVAAMAASPALAQTTPAKPAPAKPAQQQQAPAQPAPAQGQPGAGAPPTGPANVALKPEPSQSDWLKVCNKEQQTGKDVCLVTRDFVVDQGQPAMAVVVYDIKGDPTRVVRFALPPGFLIQPGIRFSVDNGKAEVGRYQLCMNACFAEGQISEATLNQLKKGTTLNVTVQNQFAREVTFQAPLAGFGKAFDGPPIDPAVLEQQQKQLQEQMQKQAEEMRKKLEAGGGAQGGAAQPAPATPPKQ